ncbi:MAG: DNA-binding NarL/FixJ family response regulator [Crocinitomicaceae bacterium]|jgi:DNA-binding NarL/FixJ family response regulator
MKLSHSSSLEVLIIDDHPLYLDGLEMMLAQSLDNIIVHKASTFEAAKAKLSSNISLDLILLDINLNGENGFDLCLLDEFKNEPIAILSAIDSSASILQAKKLGLLGFLNKGNDSDILIENITRLLNGESIFPSYSLAPSKLTPRQFEVLQLLAEGHPNKIICKQMKLTEATVKTHLRALFNILQVNTRTECVNVARKQHLI